MTGKDQDPPNDQFSDESGPAFGLNRLGVTPHSGGKPIETDKERLDQIAKEHHVTAGPTKIGTGPFGPMYEGFQGRFAEAVEFLEAQQYGEVVDVLEHKDLRPVGLAWGKDQGGLKHILGRHRHENIITEIPALFEIGELGPHPTEKHKVVLETTNHAAIVSLEFDAQAKQWLVTAFDKKRSRGRSLSRRTSNVPGDEGGTVPRPNSGPYGGSSSVQNSP